MSTREVAWKRGDPLSTPLTDSSNWLIKAGELGLRESFYFMQPKGVSTENMRAALAAQYPERKIRLGNHGTRFYIKNISY